jgi:predicted DNA-binding transcriptional regulator AlpA
MSNIDRPRLINAEEAARYLGMSRTTFDSLTKNEPRLSPIYVTERMPRWDKSELDKWIEERKTGYGLHQS